MHQHHKFLNSVNIPGSISFIAIGVFSTAGGYQATRAGCLVFDRHPTGGGLLKTSICGLTNTEKAMAFCLESFVCRTEEMKSPISSCFERQLSGGRGVLLLLEN